MLRKILIILISILNLLKADLPPSDGYHMMEINTYITNISDYSGYEVLGCVSSVMHNQNACYKLSDNQEIEKGYKFNRLYLVVIKKEDLEALGGIDATSVNESYNANGLSIQIAEYVIKHNFNDMITVQNTQIEDKYPISKEKYYYEITNIKDMMLTLKLKRRVISFTDGRKDKSIEIME